jgi:hypothetical protein
MEITQKLIDDVGAAAPELVSLRGVASVGPGMREADGEVYDELAIRVLVTDASDLSDGIPDEIAGVPVCIVEFPVEPLFFAPDTTRYPDLAGGAQIQPAPGASGTLGAVVMDAGGNLVGLTCHHVTGDPGATIWQAIAPPIVIGLPPDLTDAIGDAITVESPATQTIPVPMGLVLALSRPIDAATVGLDEAVNEGRTISDAILDNFGVVDATKPPNVGMFVKKRGSQSGPTSGLVVGIHPIVDWTVADTPVPNPPPGHVYTMTQQYEIFYNPLGCPDGIISRGGDSGSLVLEDGTHTAVGLLWGGNRQGGQRAMMCDITVVEQRLGVSVAWSTP